jgi:chromosome segregation ATPase
MSDKTFGVKVSEELHERVKNMIESSGGSAKEWFEKAVSLTEVQNLKDGSGEFKQDLTELDMHTSRIYGLVANMIQRANYLKDDAVKGLNEKLESRELTISSLQENVKEMKEKLSRAEEEAKLFANEKEELAQQAEDLRAVNANNQALIQEYKDKIDTLSSLVNEYKGYSVENAALKEGFAQEKENMRAEFEQKENGMKSSIEELKATVHNQAEQLERLGERLKNTASEKEREAQAYKDDLENQLTRLAERKDLERERVVLDIERQYQQKLQEVHEQYNEKIGRLYEKFERNEPNADKGANKRNK